MRDELKIAEAEIDAAHQSPAAVKSARNSRWQWRIFAWVLLGGLLGAILAAVFLGYAQPELLLEQMNLRYCG